MKINVNEDLALSFWCWVHLHTRLNNAVERYRKLFEDHFCSNTILLFNKYNPYTINDSEQCLTIDILIVPVLYVIKIFGMGYYPEKFPEYCKMNIWYLYLILYIIYSYFSAAERYEKKIIESIGLIFYDNRYVNICVP